MGRSSEEILADKILSETGTGPEKYAAHQRLMQDYEDYVDARVRIHQLEKQYKEEEREEERKHAGLTKAEYSFYNFLSGLGFTLGAVGPVCMFIGLIVNALDNSNDTLLEIGLVLIGVGALLYTVAKKKLKRR